MVRKRLVRWIAGIGLVLVTTLALGACMSSKDSMGMSSDKSMSNSMDNSKDNSMDNSMSNSGDSSMSK